MLFPIHPQHPEMCRSKQTCILKTHVDLDRFQSFPIFFNVTPKSKTSAHKSTNKHLVDLSSLSPPIHLVQKRNTWFEEGHGEVFIFWGTESRGRQCIHGTHALNHTKKVIHQISRLHISVQGSELIFPQKWVDQNKHAF